MSVRLGPSPCPEEETTAANHVPGREDNRLQGCSINPSTRELLNIVNISLQQCLGGLDRDIERSNSHRDGGDEDLADQDTEPQQAMPGQDTSKGFLDLLQNMVNALGIQSTSAAAPVTDLVHDMLQHGEFKKDFIANSINNLSECKKAI
ncbi:UNVERIFIED_CONTAM: hypothetical protein K2H54_038962 [Gekko kuhli]